MTVFKHRMKVHRREEQPEKVVKFRHRTRPTSQTHVQSRSRRFGVKRKVLQPKLVTVPMKPKLRSSLSTNWRQLLQTLPEGMNNPPLLDVGNEKVTVFCPYEPNKSYVATEYFQAISNLEINSKSEIFVTIDNNPAPARWSQEGITPQGTFARRRRVAQIENIGRKRALENRSDYFMIVECDLLPPRDAYRRLRTLIVNYEADIAFLPFTWHWINPQKGPDYARTPLLGWRGHYPGMTPITLNSFLRENYPARVTTCGLGCVLFTKKIFSKPLELDPHSVWCVPPETMISTNPSYKPIELLTVGEDVVTHLGDYQPITKEYERPLNGRLVSLTPYYTNIPLRLTEEHLVLAIQPDLCRRKQGKEHGTRCLHNCSIPRQRNSRGRLDGCNGFKGYEVKWVPAKELKVGDIVLYPIMKPHSTIKEVYISSAVKGISVLSRGFIKRRNSKKVIDKIQVNSSLMRLVGYYLAEGHVSRDIHFSLSENEQDLHVDIADLMQSVFGLKPVKPIKRRGCLELTFCSVLVAEFFKAYFGANSNNKHLPSWVMNAPTTLLKELVKGYYFGDGRMTLQPNDSSPYKMTTTSKTLAYQLRTIFHRLGIIVLLRLDRPKGSWFSHIRERKIPQKHDSYGIYVRGPWMEKMNEILEFEHPYTKVRKRKHRGKGWIDEDYAYIMLMKVTNEQYSGNVFNLAVKHRESYVAEGIAVHNCTDGVLAKRVESEGLKVLGDNRLFVQHVCCLGCYHKAYGPKTVRSLNVKTLISKLFNNRNMVVREA